MGERDALVYVGAWGALISTAILEVQLILLDIVQNLTAFLLSMAVIQSVIIAYAYQHLREEKSSTAIMPFTSFIMLLVLVSAAITSVLACTPYLG